MRTAYQALAYNPVESEEGVAYRENGLTALRLKLGENVREAVLVGADGREHILTKTDGPFWQGEFELGEGFQYVTLKVDGAEVLSPFLPIGYGYCRPVNYVDPPAKDVG